VSSLTGRATRPRPSRGHDVPEDGMPKLRTSKQLLEVLHLFALPIVGQNSSYKQETSHTFISLPARNWRMWKWAKSNCRARKLFRDNTFLTRRQGMAEVRRTVEHVPWSQVSGRPREFITRPARAVSAVLAKTMNYGDIDLQSFYYLYIYTWKFCLIGIQTNLKFKCKILSDRYSNCGQ
jgi:hypothetical protein